jgi:pilus assembly protein TadC
MTSEKYKLQKKVKRKNIKTKVLVSFVIGLTVGIAVFMMKESLPLAWIGFSLGIALPLFYSYLSERMKQSGRIRKMEELFPDFLLLVASNLRAGITIDQSILLSAREEFDPLDKEILKTGRDITTGKDIESALLDLSRRIGSEKIHKTILLILSGIKSGGDIATILEETAASIRERAFVEKKASSSVLMYVIFIFLAVSVGAPALFALSNILVEILTTLLSGLPDVSSANVPLTMSKINVSTNFIMWFSVIFLIAIDTLASMILGLVSKGEEKEGLKYLLPLLALSLGTFFLLKIALSGFVKGFFGG